jgi:hypothetical protein
VIADIFAAIRARWTSEDSSRIESARLSMPSAACDSGFRLEERLDERAPPEQAAGQRF